MNGMCDQVIERQGKLVLFESLLCVFMVGTFVYVTIYLLLQIWEFGAASF